MSSLIALSRKQKCIAVEFSVIFKNMLEVFKTFGYSDKLDTMLSLWDTAVSIVNINEVVLQVSIYFCKYRGDIESDNVNKLLSHDYSTEIKKGTCKATKKLINELIQVFKVNWVKADESSKVKIKDCIKNLLKKSIEFQDIESELQSL